MFKRGILRILTSVVMLSFVPLNAFSQSADKAAGWHFLCEDTIQGANIDRAVSYLAQHGKKPRKQIVVGVIDSGADTAAVNIRGALWQNRKERADGKDNDRNGYVDDLHGWNFLGTSDGSFNMTSAGTEEYRQFKRLYPKYKNVQNRDEAADKAEYDYYVRMRKKAGIKSYLMFYEFSKQKAVALVMMDSLLEKNHIVADTMPLRKVAETEMADTLWQGLCQMIYTDLLRTKAGTTWATFKKQQADNLALMKKRIDGIEGDKDKRLLMGDNMEDAADIYYGNNILTLEGCEHGTFVAGIIGGSGNGDDRYRGVARGVARLMILRASPDGDEYDKDIATAIRYAADNGAKVINISLGKHESPTPKMVNDAIAYAAERDVLIVHAAGNDGADIDTGSYYPTGRDESGKAYPNFIRVGSSDRLGQCSPFSNYGRQNVDVLAPGEEISSFFPGDKADLSQGTSLSAPVVSGIAALLRAYFPKLKASEIKEILIKSARPDGHNDKCISGGCVDMLNAVKMIMK